MKKSSSTPSEIWSSRLSMAPAISYKLSNNVFKALGWTSDPMQSVMVPVVTMKAKLSHSALSPWFVEGKSCDIKYKNGKRLCIAKENGTGQIYYPNGGIAIKVTKSEDLDGVTHIRVKTPGGVGKDGVHKLPKLIAEFDSVGNGVVYSESGKKILSYNQNDGIMWLKDCTTFRWKWHNLELGNVFAVAEEPPHVQRQKSNVKEPPSVLLSMKKMDSSWGRKSGPASASTQSYSKASVTDNSLVTEPEENHYINMSRMFPAVTFRPIIFKLCENVGLHIVNQSEIAITFFAEGKQTKINIGILYNPYDRLTTEKVITKKALKKQDCPYDFEEKLTKENFPSKVKKSRKGGHI